LTIGGNGILMLKYQGMHALSNYLLLLALVFIIRILYLHWLIRYHFYLILIDRYMRTYSNWMTFATVKVNTLAWYHNNFFYFIFHISIATLISIIIYVLRLTNLTTNFYLFIYIKKIIGGRTYCSRVQTWRMLSHVDKVVI
jgi:hypothetical protein